MKLQLGFQGVDAEGRGATWPSDARIVWRQRRPILSVMTIEGEWWFNPWEIC